MGSFSGRRDLAQLTVVEHLEGQIETVTNLLNCTMSEFNRAVMNADRKELRARLAKLKTDAGAEK